MKARACLALIIGMFGWTSSAAAFEPAEVRATPVLQSLYDGFFPAAIFKVTDGVYVARGYNRDNPVLIVGPSGLIVIDPGESREAGEVVRNAYNTSEEYPELQGIFDREPVKAIVYTHHHDCHIHGAAAFAGPHTEIIAHANMMTTLFYDWYSQLYPGRLVGGTMMSGALFASDPGWFYGGGLFATQIPGKSGFLPPTRTIRDTVKTDIAGVRITFFSVPGETRDVLLTWLPDKNLLVQIANLYEAFPAITTLRGAYPRNPLDYVASIDFYRTLNAEFLVLPHGPHPFFIGKETIARIFTNYRDGIQFLHDQTVQYMNKGFTPGEIKELVHLPPHLASEPFLQEVYGEVDRNIYEIFWWYRGYFSGNVRDLFPQSPVEQAEMAAMVAGGVSPLADRAEEALGDEKFEWALELADDVLLLDPQNEFARTIKKRAMIALAEGTINAQVRNYVLSEYLLEDQQADPRIAALFAAIKVNPKVAFARMDDAAVDAMPLDAVARILAVSLNASRSMGEDLVVGLQVSDVREKGPARAHYALHVRRGVLEVRPEAPSNPAFTLITDLATWKDLVLGRLLPPLAVSQHQVVIAGADPTAFYAFMNLFN